MSKLKVRFIDDTYVEYYNTGKHDLAQVYLKSEADETIAELKAENQRLKKCEIWMKQHFYCEEVIACESAKNRKLQRALWLARACSAEDIANHFATIDEYDPCNRYNLIFCVLPSKGYNKVRYAEEWKNIYQKIKDKCLKKAEEYK